jgi:iron(III) transport system ATP-binding protein
MAQLDLNAVCVTFGDTVAVDGVTLSLPSGEIGCLIGPSGCGKTSLLRAIAGFAPVGNGSIVIAGEVVSAPCWARPPETRAVGMLFQDLALFPHLTLAGNVGFGLRRWSRAAAQARVAELLELVGLSGLDARYPHELSGGQQQRAALARALAPRPRLLLLDEPFSSQDIERRAQLAQEVRQILQREHITALFVTHDQHEAFAMADRIGVLEAGRLHQWSTPYALYHRPADLFVADFIGHGELVRAVVSDSEQLDSALGWIRGRIPDQCAAGESVYVLVRPEDIVHDEASPRGATVVQRSFRGPDFLYTLALDNGERVLCLTSSHDNRAIGERIGIRPALEHLVVFQLGDTATDVTAAGERHAERSEV